MRHTLFSKTSHYFILVLILAAAVRFAGLHHGYPYSYYPDEAHFVKRALSFGSFDFNPHWFHKPAFYMYLLFFEYGIYFIVGKVIGLWHSTADFAVSFIRNPGPFYMIGRVTTVLFSLGSIIIVYLLGERHLKKGVGLIAGLLLALSYGHVAASQDIKADTPTMFFTIASMLFLLNYYEQKNLKMLMIAAVLAGVGTATKEYSIVMLPSMFLGILLVNGQKYTQKNKGVRKVVSEGFLVLLLFYLAHFICSPYNFLDPLGRRSTKMVEVFMRFFRENTDSLEAASTVVEDRPGFFQAALHYTGFLFSPRGLGVFICSLGFLGLMTLAFKFKHKKGLLLISYPVLFAVISIYAAPFRAGTRHQLPLYPFFALSAAYFFVLTAGEQKRRQQVMGCLLAISLLYPVFLLVERVKENLAPDTRNLAKTWIESNLPSGSKILIDENGPQLLVSAERLKLDLKLASSAESDGQFTAHYDTYLQYQLLASENQVTYDLTYIRFPWWRESFVEEGVTVLDSEVDRDMGNPLRVVGVDDLETYREKGVAYVIVQSDKYGGFFKPDSKKSKRFPAFSRFYHALFEKGVLIKEFSPAQNKAVGPVVKIFKIEGENL